MSTHHSNDNHNSKRIDEEARAGGALRGVSRRKSHYHDRIILTWAGCGDARCTGGTGKSESVSRVLPSTACKGSELDASDSAENKYSMANGFQLLSSYLTGAGEELLIITEADRSATTLLLPEEY